MVRRHIAIAFGCRQLQLQAQHQIDSLWIFSVLVSKVFVGFHHASTLLKFRVICGSSARQIFAARNYLSSFARLRWNSALILRTLMPLTFVTFPRHLRITHNVAVEQEEAGSQR